jgi:hypothetical protein
MLLAPDTIQTMVGSRAVQRYLLEAHGEE